MTYGAIQAARSGGIGVRAAATAAAGTVFLLAAAGCGGGAGSPEPIPTADAVGRPFGPRPLVGVTVLLDPGHGGQDSGAICAGTTEAAINYRMAATLATLLRAEGATVSYTVSSTSLLPSLDEGRPEPPLSRPFDARLGFNGAPVREHADQSPDELWRRAAMTRALWTALPDDVRRSGHGVYFLSLHCDKLSDPRWRGARVYCDKRCRLGPSRFALALKRRITAAGLTNSPGGQVIPREYGVLNPAYNVLTQSALLEVATISNAGDRRDVRTAAWRWRMARIIAAAIEESEGHAVPLTTPIPPSPTASPSPLPPAVASARLAATPAPHPPTAPPVASAARPAAKPSAKTAVKTSVRTAAKLASRSAAATPRASRPKPTSRAARRGTKRSGRRR